MSITDEESLMDEERDRPDLFQRDPVLGGVGGAS